MQSRQSAELDTVQKCTKMYKVCIQWPLGKLSLIACLNPALPETFWSWLLGSAGEKLLKHYIVLQEILWMYSCQYTCCKATLCHILPHAASMTPMILVSPFSWMLSPPAHWPGWSLPMPSQHRFTCRRVCDWLWTGGHAPQNGWSNQAEHSKDATCAYNTHKDVIKSYRIRNLEAAI